MDTKFNFKSSICTSREQSGRLLALGLKKETADCCYYYYDGSFTIPAAKFAQMNEITNSYQLFGLEEE